MSEPFVTMITKVRCAACHKELHLFDFTMVGIEEGGYTVCFPYCEEYLNGGIPKPKPIDIDFMRRIDKKMSEIVEQLKKENEKYELSKMRKGT